MRSTSLRSSDLFIDLLQIHRVGRSQLGTKLDTAWGLQDDCPRWFSLIFPSACSSSVHYILCLMWHDHFESFQRNCVPFSGSMAHAACLSWCFCQCASHTWSIWVFFDYFCSCLWWRYLGGRRELPQGGGGSYPAEGDSCRVCGLWLCKDRVSSVVQGYCENLWWQRNLGGVREQRVFFADFYEQRFCVAVDIDQL